jgi:hypothetical protein
VHFIEILVNNQLDAQFFFLIFVYSSSLHVSSNHVLIIMRVGDRAVPHSHLHRVTYTRGHIDTINSPDDEYMVARNMYRSGINRYKCGTYSDIYQMSY